MKTPARIPLEQTIPVSNSMDKETIVKVQCTVTKGEHCFTCPTTLKLKPNMTGYLPIKFNPTWKGEFATKINLSNPISNETFEYEIQGVGEDPLAENHIKLKLAVDEEKKVPILIRNYSDKPATFTAKLEMHGCKGPEKITINQFATDTYNMIVRPSLGGNIIKRFFYENFNNFFEISINNFFKELINFFDLAS